MSDDYKRLPGGFMFVDEGQCFHYLAVPNASFSDTTRLFPEATIEPHIVDYAFNDDYITVCQEDTKSCECYFNKGINIKSIISYYIYDIKKIKKMGPLSKNEFNELRKELGINDDLDVNYIPFNER